MTDDLSRSIHKTLLCPDCRAPFSFASGSNVTCSNCGYKVEFFGSIQLLIPTLEKKALSGMEKTFAFPSLYNRMVDLKALLLGTIPHLGIQRVVEGRHVLNVGCGPTVKAEHAEHEAASAASYTGIELSLPFVESVRESRAIFLRAGQYQCHSLSRQKF